MTHPLKTLALAVCLIPACGRGGESEADSPRMTPASGVQSDREYSDPAVSTTPSQSTGTTGSGTIGTSTGAGTTGNTGTMTDASTMGSGSSRVGNSSGTPIGSGKMAIPAAGGQGGTGGTGGTGGMGGRGGAGAR